MDKNPTGTSTVLCGGVPCATGLCPREFAKQLRSLLDAHSGPLGMLTAQQACGREAKHYGGPAGWIAASVNYLDGTPISLKTRGVPHDRIWLVVQGERDNSEAAARQAARELRPGAIIVARAPIDQSYEPRFIAID